MREQQVARPAHELFALAALPGAQHDIAQGDARPLRLGVSRVERREGGAQRDERMTEARKPFPAVAGRAGRRVR